MPVQLLLGDIAVEVVLKDIKNVHLSVHPPVGRVRISAPSRMDLDTIRVFAISKLDWIRQQRQKLHEQEREPPREYVERESLYLWGKRYLLAVSEEEGAPSVEVHHRRLLLRVRPGAGEEKRQAVMEEWYRAQLRQAVPAVIARWQPVLGVEVARFFIRRMRTKWGSCNPTTGSIRLNTDLAKKPRECLDYVAVHEMVHLLEPTHNARFIALMDRVKPNWRSERDGLNQLPVRHEAWEL